MDPFFWVFLVTFGCVLGIQLYREHRNLTVLLGALGDLLESAENAEFAPVARNAELARWVAPDAEIIHRMRGHEESWECALFLPNVPREYFQTVITCVWDHRATTGRVARTAFLIRSIIRTPDPGGPLSPYAKLLAFFARRNNGYSLVAGVVRRRIIQRRFGEILKKLPAH